MSDKLKEAFGDIVVYKNLKESNFFSSIGLPAFLRDWLLKQFQDEEGKFDIDEVTDFISKYLPKKDDWMGIKNRIVYDGERVKFLTKISVEIDIKTQGLSFALPDYGLDFKDTLIDSNVWDRHKDVLASGKEEWGVVELGYQYPDDVEKIKGKIKLMSFNAFCPYTIDLDFYKDARKSFSLNEWLDILLGAIDYNADGYSDVYQKQVMLTRLLPFVEKKINLIELAPKGTGKSYLFGRVSKFGWLSTGGTMSRAKMFYDQTKRVPGLVSSNDFVALDEIQTIKFPDVNEMRAALKGYMEQGVFTVGNYEGVADAGIVLLGNISVENMSEYQNMFKELPKEFHESALIDRFHGFIKGWEIPRMNENLKISGWALNTEYFSTIMHMLRDDVSYRAIVEKLIVIPNGADSRDTEAVKRIATGYMKLLFPHVRNEREISKNDFKYYCLDPAVKMRQIIRYQLGILDKEFEGKNVPVYEVKEF